jgi:hypothetical protein
MFRFIRILLCIFSVSVWHQQINGGAEPHNQCRLYNGLFLFVTLTHFVWSFASFYTFKRELTWAYGLANILFGSFIVMSLKPSDWFLSFQWEDCYSLYGNSVIGRTAMFSYALLILGTVEILELLANGETTMFGSFRDFKFSRYNSVLLGVLVLVMLGVSALMCWLAGGSI